jgi:hypothetical protein
MLGWATELPLLVRIDDLKKEQQPHSDDPDFWDVWTGADDMGEPVKRPASWTEVVRDWQGVGDAGPEAELDAEDMHKGDLNDDD